MLSVFVTHHDRMRVLYRLSATVRKEVGKKVFLHALRKTHAPQVIEAGGNAVLGYMSQFDVEGDSGIVARAYGTACRILKVQPVDPRNYTVMELDGL